MRSCLSYNLCWSYNLFLLVCSSEGFFFSIITFYRSFFLFEPIDLLVILFLAYKRFFWPFLCKCCLFYIFDICQDPNPESCRSKQGNGRLSTEMGGKKEMGGGYVGRWVSKYWEMDGYLGRWVSK
jgi:hypothetical protein